MGSSSYLVSRALWVYVMLVSVSAAESRILLDKEECHLDDLKGLKDFKASIKSDTSGRLETWTGERCCIWDGVSCDNKTGRVNKLYLPGFITSGDAPDQTYMEGWLSPSITLMVSLEVIDLSALSHLTGQIPPQIGFHLPKLRELTLFGNRLSGSLPESIGAIPESITNLTNMLSLDLHQNSLTGNIPADIGNLQFLEELDLSNNSLSGTIPSSICKLTFISTMYLNTNNLEGEIPFPTIAGQMSALKFLRLQNNRLSGRLPSAFGFLTSLQRVSLSNNQLEGPIPYSLGTLRSLSELYLDGNNFSGQIPSSLGHLSQLLALTISNNMLQEPLPHELSLLLNLQILDLSFNDINLSVIPEWLLGLPSLSQIYLAGCGIRGEIPDYLQKASSSLQVLDLSENHLTGEIPTWFGNLTQIWSLNLSRNSLTSTIPKTITNLGSLTVLDIHSNKLTGTINEVFHIQSRFEGSLTYIDLSDNRFTSGIEQIGRGSQTGIQYLNLSHNHFNGRIPTLIGKLKSVDSLDLSYNELSSQLPISLANAHSLERLKLQKNQITGNIPNQFLNLRRLKELDVSDNLLVGRIPLGKPLSDFPRSTYSGNKGLCGKPLDPCMS
nr:PREDICTED: LRR receptor-like serine/threonine-protein kinase GSO1 isoform X2 [Daucus carota subsp. sativus]